MQRKLLDLASTKVFPDSEKLYLRVFEVPDGSSLPKTIPIFLRKQCIAITEFVSLLIQSHIQELLNVQRTWDEVSGSHSIISLADKKEVLQEFH